MTESLVPFERHTEEFVKGFALSGEIVEGMADKNFTIKDVKYEKSPDLDNPSQMKEKMVITVVLADGQIVDWYPNKTSQRTILSRVGYKTSNWTGLQAKFYTMLQKVGNVDRRVIYVAEK